MDLDATHELKENGILAQMGAYDLPEYEAVANATSNIISEELTPDSI